MPNLMLPGNPRYQPKDLVPFFGYDNLMKYCVRVELAAMDTLGRRGVIPAGDYALLTLEVRRACLEITTSMVDERERAVTKHDIRALVQLMQERMPVPLRRWVHVPLTSYDVIDTARALMFQKATSAVIMPKLDQVIGGLRHQAHANADLVQIGRTHGQHALPITAGYWFATVLKRLEHNRVAIFNGATELAGKISGPVGAYNASHGLMIDIQNGVMFEADVLSELGLARARYATQIVPPEALSSFLFACLQACATLGQFASDARHLMRTEIGEIAEPFEAGQVGSSTMAHKRNPITFENIEGMWRSARWEFGKVLETMTSEHQRDLVGSSIGRDLPVIVVRLVSQLDALLRPGKTDTRPFVTRIIVDRDACERNVGTSIRAVMAEPLYLALQMAGYEGDAHHLVNHELMPYVSRSVSLVDALETIAKDDGELAAAWARVPDAQKDVIRDPRRYTGLASLYAANA